ncbi:Cytochrome P450 [Lasiodiplodia theobromae]|uniref:Cytokinin hydroxylase n=1 Tax=Lasiodiplodia theobromae TaxID=45133 RepID=A0A5N5DQD2_9PEZI|nr:Cytochrome P450 [Lasiodiplodia theobromae]KAB2580149.1 Cytokinin hydroxylase [Lasiodiplodia theobromae]KAF4546754.1 Cytochrome P450 [Lasiodiplodia theobromae]KAF9632163.1 Cytochrome P450 [Lasiodiplodia theobromae]
MAPTSSLALASVAESMVLARYAPAYSITNSNFLRPLALFWIQMLLWFTWSAVIYPHFLSPLRHLPQPKGGHWLMGHFNKIRKENTGEPAREWSQTVPNEGLIYYRFAFNSERVLVTSPKGLAEVLVHKNYEFIKPGTIRDGIGRILGIGILLAEGDEHKRQRKLLMPAFHFRHVKDLYPVFWTKAQEAAQAMIAAIQQPAPLAEKPSSVVDIANWASRATLDIIGVAGMGKDFGAVADPNSELNATYRRIFSPNAVARFLQLLGLIIPFWVLRKLPIKRNMEVDEAAETIKRISREIIQSKRKHLEKNERTEVDIVSVALESGGFSDEDLVNQMMTFLAAGHETTATSLTWVAYLLAKHPDVQKRLREEIRANLPSPESGKQITSTDIDRLPYLNAVCNEVLRFYAPVPMTLRISDRDTTILGKFIPKGTTIVLSPWATNTSKELWGEDAMEFNPDRWLGTGRANTGGADSNYSFLTFLHGPRSCIGQAFAKAEFACLVAVWIGKFEMELANPDAELELQSGITARPKGGLPVKLKVVDGW